MSPSVGMPLQRSIHVEPKRILIVDDEQASLALSSALRTEGVEVITASKIESAEEALARYPFELVIVDIKMSGILGIEGLELLSYIKRFRPRTEVIVLSSHGTNEMRSEARDRGASCFFEKPVDIIALSERIREMGMPVKR